MLFFSSKKEQLECVYWTDGSFHLDYLLLKIASQKLKDLWDCLQSTCVWVTGIGWRETVDCSCQFLGNISINDGGPGCILREVVGWMAEQLDPKMPLYILSAVRLERVRAQGNTLLCYSSDSETLCCRWGLQISVSGITFLIYSFNKQWAIGVGYKLYVCSLGIESMTLVLTPCFASLARGTCIDIHPCYILMGAAFVLHIQ